MTLGTDHHKRQTVRANSAPTTQRPVVLLVPSGWRSTATRLIPLQTRVPTRQPGIDLGTVGIDRGAAAVDVAAEAYCKGRSFEEAIGLLAIAADLPMLFAASGSILKTTVGTAWQIKVPRKLSAQLGGVNNVQVRLSRNTAGDRIVSLAFRHRSEPTIHKLFDSPLFLNEDLGKIKSDGNLDQLESSSLSGGFDFFKREWKPCGVKVGSFSLGWSFSVRPVAFYTDPEGGNVSEGEEQVATRPKTVYAPVSASVTILGFGKISIPVALFRFDNAFRLENPFEFPFVEQFF